MAVGLFHLVTAPAGPTRWPETTGLRPAPRPAPGRFAAAVLCRYRFCHLEGTFTHCKRVPQTTLNPDSGPKTSQRSSAMEVPEPNLGKRYLYNSPKEGREQNNQELSKIIRKSSF